jgi:hypothetical protein
MGLLATNRFARASREDLLIGIERRIPGEEAERAIAPSPPSEESRQALIDKPVINGAIRCRAVPIRRCPAGRVGDG